MRHEHVNTAREVVAVVSHLYAEVRRAYFGLSDSLSLYQFLECRAPQARKCRQYIDGEHMTGCSS
jgi:hypothetical protein